MNKKTSLLIGTILLIIAIAFILYALNHPEATFPWGNKLTLMIYGAYTWLILVFLVFKPFCKPQKGNMLFVFIFLFLAVTSILTELSMEKADFYTFLRGFATLGGIVIGMENLYLLVKKEL